MFSEERFLGKEHLEKYTKAFTMVQTTDYLRIWQSKSCKLKRKNSLKDYFMNVNCLKL
jgi:hypothetical protein